jgi:hypothetical protein
MIVDREQLKLDYADALEALTRDQRLDGLAEIADALRALGPEYRFPDLQEASRKLAAVIGQSFEQSGLLKTDKGFGMFSEALGFVGCGGLQPPISKMPGFEVDLI